MAKRRRKPVKQITTRPAQNENKSRSALDGYINSLAYLGEASELTKASDYERHSITRDYELLTTMYRENWIAKRIIDTPCEDMTRAWYTVSSELEQDKLDELAKLEAKHNIKQEITNGLRWARLYGGAAAVMVIKGQEDMLSEPLDFDTLTPGCFRGLIIVDRTNGLYPSLELEDDMDDPEFGYPKYYDVTLDNFNGETLRIHHSRMLEFRGRMLPIQEEINEDYWGASELEHIYEELQKRNATSANIAQLVFQANVSALKIGDYGETLAMGTETQKAKIMESIFNMNRIRNSFGMLLMGSEDNYEQHPYSFAGIAEVYESFMMDMAGAAEIPATKLYGRSPQGMNATGDSDMKNYYEMLAQLQERNLRPAIEKLLPVMAMSLWGNVPEDMEVVFEPLMTTTPDQRAQIMSQQVGAIVQAFSAGLISQRTALLEMQEQGKPISAWTNITDEDIENADDEVDSGEGMEDPMGMMGAPGGGPEGGMGAPQESPQEAPQESPQEAPEEAPQEAPEAPEKPPEGKDPAGEMRQIEEALKGKEEGEDGGPGSGPRPGYKKNGTSLIERAKFIADPTEGHRYTERSAPRTKASVERENRERNQWSDLSMKQKLVGGARQDRHIRKVKAEVLKAAAKGDLEKARAIVKKNRHYWQNDPDSAMKTQSEMLKRQKAVKSGFIHDFLNAFLRKESKDEDVWRTNEEGHHFKFDNQTGEIKAGFGGKHNGKRVGESWGKSGTEKYFRVKAPEKTAPKKENTAKIAPTFTHFSDGTERPERFAKKHEEKYNEAKTKAESTLNNPESTPEEMSDAVYSLERSLAEADGRNEGNTTNEYGIEKVPRKWEERLTTREREVLSKINEEYSDLQYRDMERWENENPEANRLMIALQGKLLGAEIEPKISKEIAKKYLNEEERVEVPGQQSMFIGENVE